MPINVEALPILELDEGFGANLRAVREDRGRTQTFVAQQMVEFGFVTWRQTTCAKVEAGERRPLLAEAVALCIILEVELPILLGDVGWKVQPVRGRLREITRSRVAAFDELARMEKYIAQRRRELGGDDGVDQ